MGLVSSRRRKLCPRQKALEFKPHLHPEVLRQQVWAFNLPERVGD
jgi:hypothetical protein